MHLTRSSRPLCGGYYTSVSAGADAGQSGCSLVTYSKSLFDAFYDGGAPANNGAMFQYLGYADRTCGMLQQKRIK